ncbi:MAG: hypothetical protein RJA09_1111 [Pseudomonadota bacterium]|jgi:nicotinamidase-related amidase
MLLNASESQLVLVDYQTRLMPAIHQGSEVLQRAVFLAQVAQALGVPTYGTEQTPAKLGGNDPQLKALCRQTLDKIYFDATQSELIEVLKPEPAPQRSAGNARSLPRHLQKPATPSTPNRNTIVLAGVEAHICLLQTALGLVEQEFDVWVVTDACGSRRERDRDAAFDRLAGNGVELVTSEMVAYEWLEHADHPRFRDVLQWVKA